MAEPEDEDDFPNDYDGLDFDNIPELQVPTTRAPEVYPPSTDPQNTVPSAVASPVPSTGSDSIEDMDSSFLAAVDALEARVLDRMPRGSGSLPRTEPGSRPTDGKAFWKQVATLPKVMVLSTTVPWYSRIYGLSSVNRKGKRKADPQEDIDARSILAGYETELTCPICCDLFVGAQVANPCGHTCCGECGYGWLARNKCEPTCAVCRSSLSARKPLLPNFSVDNFVRQHLEALARSGRPEWQEKGYKTLEWNKRLETWKKQLSVRAAKEKSKETTRLRRRQPRYYQFEEYSYAAPWLIDESMGESEETIVARVTPRRGTRSRR